MHGEERSEGLDNNRVYEGVFTRSVKQRNMWKGSHRIGREQDELAEGVVAQHILHISHNGLSNEQGAMSNQ